MVLLTDNEWVYNMLISGFILGTVIFALFVWQAYQNYRNVKQIRKFKTKTKNYYEDKYAWGVIRTFELVITVLWVAELVMFIVAEVLHSKYIGYEDNHKVFGKIFDDLPDATIKALTGSDLANYNTWLHKGTIASGTGIAHNVIFLVNAVFIISYMAVAYLWNSSLIVVVDLDNLITTQAVCPRRAITVSRILGENQLFKITYRDPDLKGNLKDFKLRYTRKLEAFLIKNGYYKGEADD